MKIIDIHAHDGSFPHGEPNLYDYLGETMEQFNADLDKDDVSHCFITSTTALLDADVIKGNQATFYDSNTDSRLFAYIYYNPCNVNLSLTEIEKYKNHHKFIGFKSRPSVHRIPIDHIAYEPLLEASVITKQPILLHCFNIADVKPVLNVAKKYPSANIIMVHACNNEYVFACLSAKPYSNIFFEPVTSTHFPDKIRKMIDIVGHERLMFGSDYGLLSRKRVISTYEEAKLSSVEYEAIFRTNAERVFNIKNNNNGI